MNELMELLNEYDKENVSIVFGNEQSGLSNEELQLCNYLVSIPTDSAYTSLNLASSVQIFSYEYFKSCDAKPISKKLQDLANHSSKLVLIEKFLSIMSDLDIYESCMQVTGHTNKCMPFCASRGGRLCRDIAQALVSCCASSASSKPA